MKNCVSDLTFWHFSQTLLSGVKIVKSMCLWCTENDRKTTYSLRKLATLSYYVLTIIIYYYNGRSIAVLLASLTLTDPREKPLSENLKKAAMYIFDI